MSTPASIIAAQLPAAFALPTGGELEAAAAGYRAVLNDAPRNFTAAHLLGVIHLQRGENAEAEQMIAKALRVEPRDATALSNRGLALRALGRLDEALMCFNKSA